MLVLRIPTMIMSKGFLQALKCFRKPVEAFMLAQAPVLEPSNILRIKLIVKCKKIKKVLVQVSIIGNDTEFVSSLYLLAFDGIMQFLPEDFMVICTCRERTIDPHETVFVGADDKFIIKSCFVSQFMACVLLGERSWFINLVVDSIDHRAELKAIIIFPIGINL